MSQNCYEKFHFIIVYSDKQSISILIPPNRQDNLGACLKFSGGEYWFRVKAKKYVTQLFWKSFSGFALVI